MNIINAKLLKCSQNADNTVLISGVGGETKTICIQVGTYTMLGQDSGADTWNGATIKVVNEVSKVCDFFIRGLVQIP